MIDRDEARTILLDVMEESALEVASVIAAHRFDDQAVWKLMHGMDAVRRRGLDRLDRFAGGARDPEEPRSTAHPAIEEYLVRLQKDRRRCAQLNEAEETHDGYESQAGRPSAPGPREGIRGARD